MNFYLGTCRTCNSYRNNVPLKECLNNLQPGVSSSWTKSRRKRDKQTICRLSFDIKVVECLIYHFRWKLNDKWAHWKVPWFPNCTPSIFISSILPTWTGIWPTISVSRANRSQTQLGHDAFHHVPDKGSNHSERNSGLRRRPLPSVLFIWILGIRMPICRSSNLTLLPPQTQLQVLVLHWVGIWTSQAILWASESLPVTTQLPTWSYKGSDRLQCHLYYSIISIYFYQINPSKFRRFSDLKIWISIGTCKSK